MANTRDPIPEPAANVLEIPPEHDRVWTVPNVLSGLRLISSPGLLFLAAAGESWWCLWLFLVLLMTDWFDGKLAILLRQRSTLGARIDSYADVTLYGCTLIAVIWLKGAAIRSESLWIGLAVGSYGLNVLASWIKFRRVPSYHTRLAKTCWFLIGVAVLATLGDWALWPLRLAMIAGILANAEEILITMVLPDWRVDVTSLYHAVRDRKPDPANETI